MLELLSLRKGTTLTKEMFLNHLYGGMDEPELKIIDVFICKLRKKLANATERQELHRDRLGPRLCAARADRGRRAHPRLSEVASSRFGSLLPTSETFRTPPEMAGFSFSAIGCWGVPISKASGAGARSFSETASRAERPAFSAGPRHRRSTTTRAETAAPLRPDRALDDWCAGSGAPGPRSSPSWIRRW